MQASFYSKNRQNFTEAIRGGVAVLSAYTSLQRSNDTAHLFEQEANFWWLTGVESPDWQLIIDGSRQKSWLVSPEISESHQIFDGSLPLERAKAISGVDAVISSDEAGSMLRQLAKKHSIVYTLGDQPHAAYLDFVLNPAPKKLHDNLVRIFTSVQDCRKELAALRAIKQPEELEVIKKAIDVTVLGFELVKRKLPELKYEYEVEAEFSYFFRFHGAKGHAYDPIVASGKNACTLHYADNNDSLKRRDLLLMDVGARMSGYAADITRTYAVGKTTKRQLAVHGAVEAAHNAIIDILKPGLLVEEYQRHVDTIMGRSLLDVGLMRDEKDETNYRKYFPHAISHGLGVDVHDSLGAPKYLQPGMILTVEPGIYIPEEGIGVRIEDDILITDNGHINLSAHLSTGL